MRKVLFCAVGLWAVLLQAAPASAGTHAIKVTPDSFDLTTQNPVKVSVHQPSGKYSEVQSVCFSFQFGSDALDPGEEVFIAFAPTPQETIGFSNPSTTPQTSRTLCLQATYDNTGLLTKFADGKARITIGMYNGSVSVTNLSVEITGTAR